MNNLLLMDKNIFSYLNSFAYKNNIFDLVIKFFAVYLVYLVPIGLIIAWFIYKSQQNRIDMLKATLVSVFLWQVPTRLIAMLWYRPRPIIDLANSKEIFFHVPSYSFPSDHSTFLAAFATYLYLLGYKKIAYFAFAAAFLVGVFRVIGGLHYPFDILAGWILGIIGSILIYKADKYIQKYLAQPLLKLAKIIKLA